MKKFVFAVVALVLAAQAAPAAAASYKDRQGGFGAQFGLGFDVFGGDAGFSMAGAAEAFLTKEVSLVPRFTIDIHDGANIYTITGDLRYTLDLQGAERLQPFAEIGAGVAFLDADAANANETAFQFEFGGGANYYVADNVALGTEMLFTFPIDMWTEDFLWQWQVVTARVLF